MAMSSRTGRISRFSLLVTSTFLTGMAFAPSAFAATASNAAGEAAGETTTETAQDTAVASGITDIVVTATRTAQSVQKVPISIMALSPERLSERNVSDFAGYANLVPSLSFKTLGPGKSEPFFRGISVNGGQLPTVGVYLDDVPTTTSGRMVDVHVYDIERVEALSGPQGTLYGASSLAGTMRIITNKPKIGLFEAGYELEGNKYGAGDMGGQARGFVNLPVNDAVAIRLMGFYKHEGGYIDNMPGELTFDLGDDDPDTTFVLDNADLVEEDYNSSREFGGRASMLVELGDGWKINPSLTYQDLEAKGAFNFDPDVGDLEVRDYSETYNKDRWYQAALTIEGRLGAFDVTSSTGYFRRRIKNANDYTYYTVTYDNFGPGYENYLQFRDEDGEFQNPAQAYFGNNTDTKLTQELRISVPESWPFQMTAGAFYQLQKSEVNSDYYIPNLGHLSTLPINADSLHAVKRDAAYLTELNRRYRDYALFAEGTYQIVPDLNLTAGLRWFDTKNSTVGFAGVKGSAIRAGCEIPFPEERLSCFNNDLRYAETGQTHKVSLSYQIEPSKMVYATYSTGFRPGGGNRIAPNSPYKADTLANYEAGFKTTWGGIFRLNGAVYYENWQGIQYSVVPFGYNGAGMTVNAGDANVYGIELDAELKLGGLTLTAAGAYNDAALASDFCKLTRDGSGEPYQLDSCEDESMKAALKGTRLPRQPKLKLNANARYAFELGDLDSFVQLSGFYQTNSTSDLDTRNNMLLGNTDGFASFDLSAGVRKDNWRFEAFLQNAFDKRGILSKNTFCSIQYCSDSSRSFPIKPRFFGVRFAQNF